MASAQTVAAASGRLLELPRCLYEQTDFAEALAALRDGRDVAIDGVWGSGSALLAASLAHQATRPLVVVCPDQNSLDDLFDDLELFSQAPRAKFPAWESELSERIVHDEIYGDRLRLLKQLSGGKGVRTNLPERPEGCCAQIGPDPFFSVIVTSIQSLLQPVPGPDAVSAHSRWLRVGDQIEVDEFLRWLVQRGFHHTSAVELPGEFSSRGGIIDIFAPDWVGPVRVELFDTEVESIRQFEVASQRSLESLPEVEITVLTPSAEDRELFTAFLPKETWILIVEPRQVEEEGRRFLQRLERPEKCHGVSSVMQALLKFPTVTASSLTEGTAGTTYRLQTESVERFSGDIENARNELDRIGEGCEVFIVAPTDAEIERLREILRTTKLAARGQLNYCIGSLQQGFRLVRERVIVLTSNDLFHRGQLRRKPRRRLGKVIDSFLDLQPGNLVVHLAHGIGRYRGMQLLEKQSQLEEHLEIEFHGGTKIYVPASKIDLVQKYVGGTKGRPSLAKIGGRLWQRQKKAAESAVTDLASDMLEMQAARAARPGIAFAQETDWQREFDASFPYQETDDQNSAWDSIKEDMIRSRPMDRLLCGDVGFGKTEIAMRAAFKAVENGYQVAVLAPTTILVEQHFQTFCERMVEFPFDIAKLSRFCTAKQQRETVEGLGKGRVDIVIGTHRLASKDVKFFNLGLVIIDEEQRFGVEVKERLKTLRATVDVLTMTATPIPRTLHLSLLGVRDISNLETPPEDRLSVETRVTRFDAETIRHAVMRELSRGGQTFFVHNRVGDIEVVKKKLEYIVPEASIRIGHGQMPESALEQVMIDFVAHKFDLLLATTIVESGLDIPNANTIFIDEADRYGLSDLHQLRGRVGRYKHRAYSYLLVDPHKQVTPNAAKRLRAIAEFSEIGAGFSIAMRDLEIRGAGNILGTQQSGHIATVGYELYCQLLENAVRNLKQMPQKLTVDVDVDLPGEAYLPDDYIGDMRMKIDLYRRIARIETYDQVTEFHSELVDRFGPPPPVAKRLLALAELRLDAAVWQVEAVFVEDRFLVFRYTNRKRIEHLAQLCDPPLRVVDQKSAYVPLSKGVTGSTDVLAVAKSVLQSA